MFFLYCTEIAMFRSGISDYKNIFKAILLLKWLFTAYFGQLRLYPFIFAIKWVGLGLGVG